VPVTDLISPAEKGLNSGRVIIDLRKLSQSQDGATDAPLKIIQQIAQMRHDWNGEVISLRRSDVGLLKIFAHYTDEDLNYFLENFALTKLK
jgi:hypothetical protein